MSKSVKPPSTRVARSALPTTSAPASSASRALSPSAKTATRTSRPVPCGSISVPRSCWSAWRTLRPSRKCASTVSSNLTPSKPFRMRIASTGEYACSRSIWPLACLYRFPCAAIRPPPPRPCCAPCRRRPSSPSVDLLHLVEGQLDRHLALEDVDEDLQLLLVGVHVDDLAVEVRERSGCDLHRLAERELHLRPRALADARSCMEDPVDLALRERHGLRAGADEAGHARSVLHDRPGVVVQVHVHEHVAGQDALLGLHLLPVLRLDDLLGRDDDAAEARVLAHRVDAVLEVGLHLVLVPGVGVDHVPAEHRRPLLPQEDVLDHALPDQVVRVQVDADDEARDEHDHGALDHLRLVRPLDFLQLAPRLPDEPARPAAGSSPLAALALRP